MNFRLFKLLCYDFVLYRNKSADEDCWPMTAVADLVFIHRGGGLSSELNAVRTYWSTHTQNECDCRKEAGLNLAKY